MFRQLTFHLFSIVTSTYWNIVHCKLWCSAIDRADLQESVPKTLKPTTACSTAVVGCRDGLLNEVEYGQSQYVVEKFGEPTAAIVSMEDFSLIQAARQRQAAASLQQIVAGVRARSRGLDPDELNALIEEARAGFYDLQSGRSDAN